MTAAFQEQLRLIKELSEIDFNLHNLKLVLEGLPEQLKDVEIPYVTVKAALGVAKEELAAVEKAKRSDEADLAASVDHLRTREAKLYAIKTNKEYQAALKEVSEGKRLNKEREDRILQAMEKIESLTQNITQLEKECADKESAYTAKRDAMQEEEGRIHEKMSGDAERRPSVAGQISKDVIRKYEFVRQRYALAMAGVKGGVCQGCSTRIPPQLFNEMLRQEVLKSCPSCQRLLYVAEQSATESNGEGK